MVNNAISCMSYDRDKMNQNHNGNKFFSLLSVNLKKQKVQIEQ